MKKAMLKWFTLLEMIIVMIIIGILAVVLTESYISISKTALRIEQERNLSEESLILTQTFQAISDEATIDYDAYSWNLVDTSWYTNILYLTWWQWSWTKIYTTGENCLELNDNFPPDSDWNYPDYTDKVRNALSWCELRLQQWDKTTSLISNGKVVVSNVKFRIIPYDSDEKYFSKDWEVVINDVHQPAFRMFVHLYAPLYQPTWINKLDQPLQLFFNLNL